MQLLAVNVIRMQAYADGLAKDSEVSNLDAT